jgi:hypothetical protein
MRNLLLVAEFAANTAPIPSAQGVPGERFENWVFSAPQGWDTREDADGLRLTSPDGQATIRSLPGEELSSIGLTSWLDGQLVLLEQGLTLQTAEDPQSTATSDHYEWLVWARGLRNRQGPLLPRSYLAADPRGRAELLVFTALTAEAFQRYLPALGQFIDSVKFANVLGIPKLPPRTLPAIPVPSAADLSSLGLTAERLKIEPIPDEFRCYFRRASDDYSSPDFLLQILSGRQYRTAAGTGSFTVAAQPESGQIQWRSGPLATPQGAVSVSFGTLGRQNDGQLLLLSNAPLGRSGGARDANCYQRGAREARAKEAFGRLDPRPGSYPCVTRFGEDPAGALAILSGRRYRYGGAEGTYSVNIMDSQLEPLAALKFFGGPLGFGSGSYGDDPPGRQLYIVSAKVSLRCAAKP